jgi:hypothetical protein
MGNISSRRFLIAVALLVTGVAGALLRGFSSPQSTPYYLGTLLMVMWIPIVGNIISFLARRLRPKAAPESPLLSMPFVSQMVVRLDLHAELSPQSPKREQDGKIHCFLILGTEGFSVRVSPLDAHAANEDQAVEVQFLVPELALTKFSVGSTFKLMQGVSVFGTGQVLSFPRNA